MYSFFFFKQKTAYEMRISDWSSDVCSSDLNPLPYHLATPQQARDDRAARMRPARGGRTLIEPVAIPQREARLGGGAAGHGPGDGSGASPPNVVVAAPHQDRKSVV